MNTEFVTRLGWGHFGPRGGHDISATRVDLAVCHHTPGQQPTTYREACEDLQRILSSHLRNGWADIGYTWVVWDRYAFEGRGWGRTGAHAPGANSTSVGIAFLLDGRRRAPTPVEWQTARDVMSQGITLGHVRPGYRVTGHRDWAPTECPSQPVYDRLGDFAAAVPPAEASFAPAGSTGTPPPAPTVAPEEDDMARQFQTPDGTVWMVHGIFKTPLSSDALRVAYVELGLLHPDIVQVHPWTLDEFVEVEAGTLRALAALLPQLT